MKRWMLLRTCRERTTCGLPVRQPTRNVVDARNMYVGNSIAIASGFLYEKIESTINGKRACILRETRPAPAGSPSCRRLRCIPAAFRRRGRGGRGRATAGRASPRGRGRGLRRAGRLDLARRRRARGWGLRLRGGGGLRLPRAP